MTVVNVSKDISGRIIVTFPYDPTRVARIKSIPAHKWHPDKRYCLPVRQAGSFPNSNGILEKILKVFEQEEIHLDPALEIKPTLIYDLVRKAIQTRHYSRRTEQTYVDWIKRFVLFHSNRHPSEMGEKEINAFLSHLAVDKHVSASTQNQALNAIVFLYKNVLKQPVGKIDGVVRAKRPRRLPVVLTKQEVKSVLSHLEEAPWIIANLLYGAGLRLLECLRLRVKDVDFTSNQIYIRDGKGQKDRVTMLPVSLKASIIKHLKQVRQLHQKDIKEGFGRVYLP